MKYVRWMTLCLFVAGTTWAQQTPATSEPTVDQILEKYITATGGADAYSAVKTMVSHGTYSLPAQGIKGTVDITWKAPDKMLMVINVPGIGEIRKAMNGMDAWSKDFNGLRTMDLNERLAMQREVGIDQMVKWKTMFKSIKLVGTEKLPDGEAYVLEFVPKVGKPIKQYFDKQTNLLVRVDGVYESKEATMPISSIIKDYRQVGALKVPFTTATVMAGMNVDMSLTSVKLNVPVSDSVFKRPVESKKPSKKTTTKKRKKSAALIDQ